MTRTREERIEYLKKAILRAEEGIEHMMKELEKLADEAEKTE